MPPVAARVEAGAAAIDTLAASFDRILLSCADGIRGPDVTCASAWAKALVTSIADPTSMRTLVLSSGGQPVALLPTVMTTVASFPLARRELRMLTEANHGRASLLVLDNDAALVQGALDHLIGDLVGWDTFILTVVADSDCHAAVVGAVERLALRTRVLLARESPYIVLPASWDDLFATLPKKMRWTIRKGEKDLAAKGQLTYEQFQTPDSVPRLHECMLSIERRSWKESSGSSITSNAREQSFYDALLPVAARSALLSGHVLLLDGQPLAYILGINDGRGTFLDLKESFDASFADFSPGHVLKRFAFENLIREGVRTYDFMGRCDPYKMKWTDKTYRRITLAVYHPSARGLLAYARSKAGDLVRSLRTRAARVSGSA